jgi:hypothetical protein
MAAHQEMTEYVERWQEAWKSDEPPYLVYQRGAGRLTVTDGRDPESPRVLRFDELAALVYESCAPTARAPAPIVRALHDERGVETDEETVQAVLDEFVSERLMLEEGGAYLSLALPVNTNW